MSGFVEGIVEGTEEAVEAVVGDVEAVLRPRPGGKIDTARHQRHVETLAGEPVAQQDYLIKGRPVAVDVLPPATGTAITVTLGTANPALPILPADTTRRTAIILAVDNDVYLSSDPGAAMTAANSGGTTAQGVFYLPAKVPLPWDNTAQLWAGATTTASSSRVSVIASFKGV